MSLSGKKKSKKGKKKGGKKKESLKRYIGSVWENEGKNGTFLSISIDNQDPDDKYYRGKLMWFDTETEKYYQVKSLAVYDADKGPDNLLQKVVMDLDNEYHVEELDLE